MKEFKIQPTIKYGEDSLEYISSLKGEKVFIVTDKMMVKLKIVDKITNILSKNKISYEIFDEVEPNPCVSTIIKGLKRMFLENVDIVIGLGGGSPIDACKSMLYFKMKLQDKMKLGRKKPLFIAIPTTSGTGTEVTSYSVITEGNRKLALANDDMLPDIALLNPEFTKTVPQSIVADTGMDVLTHAIEAYVSNNKNPFSDAMAIEAIGLIYEYLNDHYLNVEKMVPREKVQQASCLAGIAFNNSGLGIAHSIAHTIGGKFKISHGRANAIILPYVIEVNIKKSPERYCEIAKKIGLPAKTTDEGVLALLIFVKELRKRLKIENSLKEYGIDRGTYEAAIPEMIKDIEGDICTQGNPVKLDNHSYEILLKKIYSGN